MRVPGSLMNKRYDVECHVVCALSSRGKSGSRRNGSPNRRFGNAEGFDNIQLILPHISLLIQNSSFCTYLCLFSALSCRAKIKQIIVRPTEDRRQCVARTRRTTAVRPEEFSSRVQRSPSRSCVTLWVADLQCWTKPRT